MSTTNNHVIRNKKNTNILLAILTSKKTLKGVIKYRISAYL